ncbi:ATP-binding protein [Enterococcus hulanensis]|uniref:ATP-binding protein n=1 Tax=Enterococcus hulanensis TaxID=2559929 RepID=UPI0010F70CF0|nr:ATP-binding protein [Enterococcus hulanensis]
MTVVKNPIVAIKDNLLLTSDNNIWAYFQVSPKTITQNNPNAIQENKEQMANLMQLLAPYEDVELIMFPRTMNLSSKFTKLSEGFDKKNPDLGEYYSSETVNLLEREGTIYRPSFLLGVKIKDQYIAESLKELFNKLTTELVDEVLGFAGYEWIDGEELLDRMIEVSNEVTQLLYSFSIRPLDEKEMIYVNRLQYIRGMRHKIEDENHWQDIEDIQSAVIRPIKKGKGILKIEDELGESYLSILPIGNFPDNMSNMNIFQFAQNLNFPVEFRMKLHYPELMGSQGLQMRAGWLNNRFKDEQSDQEKHGDEPTDRVLTIRYLLKHMRERMNNGEPIIDWLGCFVVYGNTRQEVRQRSLTIIKLLSQSVKVCRGKNDQIKLFYKLLMGQSLGNQTHWKQRTNVAAIAELLFGTITELGMDSGWYIGRQDVVGLKGSKGEKTELEELIYASNKYVFLNPLAIAEGIKGALYDAPHMAVTGKTGKGKTFLVGLIFLYSSFLEAQSLFIDPKGEKKKWFMKLVNDPYYQQNYPLFIQHLNRINYVTLNVNKKRNYGVLDPFVYLDRIEAKQVAQDMIDELSPLGSNHKLKGAVLEGIQKVLTSRDAGEKVGLLHVVDWLEKHSDEKIHEYGRFLQLSITDSILRLGFSYGENNGLDFKEKTTVLEIQGLTLPKDDISLELYSDADRKALCLMISLGRFCEMFGKKDIEKKTAVYFTEAWVFNKSNSGRAIISSIARVGRSQMNQLVLDTQFIDDLGTEDEKGNYGVVFAFDEDSERDKILSHLGLERNEENRKEMKRMIKGQCWMRDIYGRVGKLNVHSLFEEFTEALKTTEKTSNSEAEEQVV